MRMYSITEREYVHYFDSDRTIESARFEEDPNGTISDTDVLQLIFDLIKSEYAFTGLKTSEPMSLNEILTEVDCEVENIRTVILYKDLVYCTDAEIEWEDEPSD